jgi:vacuolar-type H+-ATPase subunit H
LNLQSAGGRGFCCGRKNVMRDVIQKVMATEAGAKQLVQAARSEAERILSASQKNAQEIKAAARQAARLETEGILNAALHASRAGKEERLARAAAEIKMQAGVDGAAGRQAADAVVRCVCGFHQSTQETPP